MIGFIRKIVKSAGVDQAAFSAISFKCWSILNGPVTILLVAAYLPNEVQGFYYTFISIAALQVLFDVGFAYVTAQFIAHDFSKLNWSRGNSIVEGEEIHLKRFRDTCISAARWYFLAAALGFIVLLAVGLVFFRGSSHGFPAINWAAPWIFNVAAISLSLLITPYFSIIEGSGRVFEANMSRLMASVCGSVSGWIVLIEGGGLFAIGTAAMIRDAVAIYLLYKKFPYTLSVAREGLGRLLSSSLGETIRLTVTGEMWSMQWRIAISWLCGYLIFQLYNPIVFYFSGPVEAGRMGMTMTIANSLGQFSLAWLASATPLLAKYIAECEWGELNAKFKLVMIRSTGLLLLLLFSGYGIMKYIFPMLGFENRILGTFNVILIFSTVLVNHVINCLAAYLRAFKREPLLTQTIVGAFLLGILLPCAGWVYGVSGVVWVGFSVTILYGFPTAFYIWQKWRKLHQSVHCFK